MFIFISIQIQESLSCISEGAALFVIICGILTDFLRFGCDFTYHGKLYADSFLSLYRFLNFSK